MANPFVNPPTSIAWIGPLAVMPFWLAYVSIAVGGLALFLFAARHYPGKAVLVAVASPAVVSGFLFGQLSLLLGGLILLAFQSPPLVKGALLALVMSIKPQLAFLAPLVLWGDWKALTGLIVAGISLLAVSLLFYGLQPWIDWPAALSRLQGVVVSGDTVWNVITPTVLAMRLGLPPFPFWLAGACFAVFIALKRPKDVDPAALLVGCSILASPYALAHDLAAVMPWAASRLLTRDWPKTGPAFFVYLNLAFPVAWVASVWPVRSTALAAPICFDRRASREVSRVNLE